MNHLCFLSLDNVFLRRSSYLSVIWLAIVTSSFFVHVSFLVDSKWYCCWYGYCWCCFVYCLVAMAWFLYSIWGWMTFFLLCDWGFCWYCCFCFVSDVHGIFGWLSWRRYQRFDWVWMRFRNKTYWRNWKHIVQLPGMTEYMIICVLIKCFCCEYAMQKGECIINHSVEGLKVGWLIQIGTCRYYINWDIFYIFG